MAWGGFIVLWVIVTVASRSAAPHLWRAYGRPLAWAVPTLFVLASLAVPLSLRSGRAGRAFAATSASILALMGLMGQGLYPSMVPALNDPALGLTIYNASSTPLTLKTMLVIALVGMPFVLAYTIFIYTRFPGPVSLDETSY